MSTAGFTKYMVAKGIKELLQTRDFEEISVGEIARHCHISRNTFCYHFKDKYDVINWIFYSEITPIIGESQSMDSWADALLALCRYLQDNRTLYRKVLHIQGQNSFSECLMDFYVQLTQNLLRNAGGEQFLTPGQIRTISRFYAFGLTGVISNWAKNGMEGDPEPVVRMLKDLLSGEIFDKLIALQQGGNAEPQ